MALAVSHPDLTSRAELARIVGGAGLTVNFYPLAADRDFVRSLGAVLLAVAETDASGADRSDPLQYTVWFVSVNDGGAAYDPTPAPIGGAPGGALGVPPGGSAVLLLHGRSSVVARLEDDAGKPLGETGPVVTVTPIDSAEPRARQLPDGTWWGP